MGIQLWKLLYLKTMADKHLKKIVQNLFLIGYSFKRYSKQKNRNYRNIRVVTLGQIYINVLRGANCRPHTDLHLNLGSNTYLLYDFGQVT